MSDSGPTLLVETAARACRLSSAALALLLVVAGCGDSAPAPATAPAPADGGVRTVNPAQTASSDGSVEPPPPPPADDPPPGSPPPGSQSAPKAGTPGNSDPGRVANPAGFADSLSNLGVRIVGISAQDGDPARIAVYLDARHVTDQGMIRPNVLPGIGQVPNMVLVLDRTRFSGRGLGGLKPLRFLVGLSLRHTPIDDAFVGGLADLKSLKWVDLRDTRVTPGAALTLFQGTSLESLRFPHGELQQGELRLNQQCTDVELG